MNKTILSIGLLVAIVASVGLYFGTRPSVTPPVIVPEVSNVVSTPTLAIGTSGSEGSVLTDSKGMTLYIFTKDTTGTTTCYGQCAVNWPPLLVGATTDVIQNTAVSGTLGTIRRVEGTLQVTMNGMPLYYFIKDVNPGDALGQGVNKVWYVLGVDGKQKGSAATTSAATTGAEATQTYTLAEVAKHATEKDCWMVIDGKVYDVTKAIPTHGGGKAILEGCGKDATTLFETRPMGSGTPHSDKARGFLGNLSVGTLK